MADRPTEKVSKRRRAGIVEEVEPQVMEAKSKPHGLNKARPERAVEWRFYRDRTRFLGKISVSDED